MLRHTRVYTADADKQKTYECIMNDKLWKYVDGINCTAGLPTPSGLDTVRRFTFAYLHFDSVDLAKALKVCRPQRAVDVRTAGANCESRSLSLPWS